MAADYKTLLGLVREFVEAAKGDYFVSDLMQRARAAIAPSPPKPTNDACKLHMSGIYDRCCSPPLMKGARAGELDNTDNWACPKCGCEWKLVKVEGTVNMWEANPAFTVGKI
jgi:hypothetical protein